MGYDLTAAELRSGFDAVCLTIGACQARELPVPGRDLDGVHLAMEFLTQQNRRIAGRSYGRSETITAEGKRVIILGGGDTGADCLGTAHRQGAEVVYQLELLPQPPEHRRSSNPWPQWPLILRTSAAHEEGGIRDYNVMTKSLSGRNGRLEALNAVRVEWGPPDETGRPTMREVEGSEFSVGVDLLLLAMGFVSPERPGIVTDLGVELDGRGNIATNAERMSSVPGVFAAGRQRARRVAGGVGHSGGPPGRARHRQVPHGPQQPAERKGVGGRGQYKRSSGCRPEWARGAKGTVDRLYG